ncbi:hypothetical protein GobsT_25730 [Gemmata obscuriglobus]|uniref:Uncharacterized protein n=1 Tax=Gemmata obscuriglobus TaxID=114 RepID=A0A2Z3H694_9BACT|nr:hypothetical protein [Gemmata obscuriglobus]AWM39147.1 hypothetical protein C1280_20600 [Gemmata obscuriglobus]QEG27809.1 hypothetical protein GobsT_25730 [Gemmata obscuriglobus]VTS05144.1 Uncharacterized protein OS=Sorangium cellulosum (strain So ce56) GN=sce5179 PE=4 SV=1 [Gemmata obscuriglobus UQM 2246]
MAQPFRSALSDASRLDKLSILPEACKQIEAGRTFPPPPMTVLTPDALQSLTLELRQGREHWKDELLKKCKPDLSPAENALAVLKAASLSVKATLFDDLGVRTGLLDKINGMLSHKQFTVAMITGGVKIGNELKTGRTLTPDLADWTSVNVLQGVADALTEVTDVPTRLVLVADGHLHSADAGLDARQADLFLETLQDDARAFLGALDVVLASPRNVLDDRWFEFVIDEIVNVREQANSNEDFRAQLASQADSLVSSVNLRARGWSYEHTVQVFGAVGGHQVGSIAAKDAEDLWFLAADLSVGYTANNHAVRDLGLVERVVREAVGTDLYIRASVHAKPGEPRLALAPSNSYARPYLLPMHSNGQVARKEGGELVYGPLFDLEGRYHGLKLFGFRDERKNRTRPLYYANAE